MRETHLSTRVRRSLSISLDDSRALRREHAATNPRFRYISIRLRGSSTIGSLCAAFKYLSLSRSHNTASKKKRRALPCSWFLTESPVWLILENETRRDLLVRVFLRKRETRKYGYIVTKKRKCSEDPTSSQATEKGNRERERERESRAEQSRRVFWTQIDRSRPLHGSRHVTGQRPVCMG